MHVALVGKGNTLEAILHAIPMLLTFLGQSAKRNFDYFDYWTPMKEEYDGQTVCLDSFRCCLIESLPDLFYQSNANHNLGPSLLFLH